jgi:hypothetical protein
MIFSSTQETSIPLGRRSTLEWVKALRVCSKPKGPCLGQGNVGNPLPVNVRDLQQ